MGRLGADPDAPMVMSRRSTLEKQPWRDLPGIENQVEANFIRPALLGESILPYRLWQTFEAVIPMAGDGAVLSAAMAHGENRGHDKLGGWMQQAETLWSRHSANATMTLVDRWNFQRGLSNQFPSAPLRVVYAKAGTLPAACVVRNERAVIDHKLYWSSPGSEQEAHYLTAIINSETARARIEQYQSRGQFGARDFDKVIFNLPIPLFTASKILHRELAQAGAHAEAVAGAVILVEGEKFQRARKRVRDALAEEGVGDEIEKLVDKLLDG